MYDKEQSKDACRTLPSPTPWGHPQCVFPSIPGVLWVSTPEHGGFHLAPERVEQMPDLLKGKVWAGLPWFEEDQDWAKVYLAFESEFEEKYPSDHRYNLLAARITLWMESPDTFREFFHRDATQAECDELNALAAARHK